MTLHSLSPAPVAPVPTDLGWLATLDQHLDPAWRPGEWHQQDWLFTGDPKSPRTRIYPCATTGCEAVTTQPGARHCTSCARLWAESGGDEEDFLRRFGEIRKHRTLRFGQLVLDRCRVTLGEQRCQREHLCQGVCEPHYTQWRGTYKRKGMTLDEMLAAGIARPLDRLDNCVVQACPRDREAGPLGLCPAHKYAYQHRPDAREPGERGHLSIEQFARTAGPIKARGNFCFLGLSETMRRELLYALQRNDLNGLILDPMIVNHAAGRLESEESLLSDGLIERALSGITKHTSLPAWLRRAIQTARQLEATTVGGDVTSGDVWNSSLVGLQTEDHRLKHANPDGKTRYTGNRAPIDFRPIRQEWLRELVKQWARDMLPTTHILLQTIDGFESVSVALSSRAGGDDPSTASIRDITRTLALLQQMRRPDGELLSSGSQSIRLSRIRATLTYLRAAGLMGHVPDGFTVTSQHRITRTTAPEESGKALPDRAIQAIVANLDKVAPKAAQTGSLMNVETLSALHRAAMRALIDTGRRPNEICALRVGCVAAKQTPTSVDYTLTYDNHKAGRDGRRIPISAETARALLDWEQQRQSLDLPAKYDQWLFPTPSAGRSDGFKHLSVAAMSHALDRLLDSMPRLDSDTPDRSGNAYLPYTDPVDLRSFRHSYAQRHADAGVDVDTLRELMDHKSIQTTMGYYRVTARRKREAIARISSLTVDRHGQSSPMSSTTAYEIGSVAVPYGNCTEPSNVKAGGQQCPVRFRCSGCDMYRPDPSYLPALEQHLVDLRANLAIVETAGMAADWVTFEMRQEITAFAQIVGGMRDGVSALGDEQKTAVEDASVALRRLRGHRPLLTLTDRNAGA